MGWWKQVVLLLFCVAGIYSAYLTQGIVSEHLATKRYGASQERFSHLESLNGAQALACFLWAWVILFVMQQTGQVKAGQTAHWTAYWKAGISNSLGPAFGMIALKNITYSAQVLVKSCKMVPVMLAGTLLHGKRYNTVEYVCMSLIGLGVALFGKKSSTKVASKLASPNTLLGYSLCLLNLALDGYTNAAQDQINHHHPRNPPIHMMCWMNFWTALYYLAYLFGFTQSGTDMISFCTRNPDAALDVLVFCLCGAFGQLFIFFTIKTFGSLVNTLVCTTRKFFNILISVVVNANPLLPMQWTAVCMVFTGLIASSLLKARGHGRGKHSQQGSAQHAATSNGRMKHQ
ncbi:uncharacterized protein HaLaN_22188 [Haematococcus lacustris]|uniref:Uncharacterized protein n=1 Tax=Haematococcus lacustris TaxID=44745 RepID=A0A699ZXN3_HAELA|nr:uncharacterized protein HaLaN_22188 [Haematococcus lacustris]